MRRIRIIINGNKIYIYIQNITWISKSTAEQANPPFELKFPVPATWQYAYPWQRNCLRIPNDESFSFIHSPWNNIIDNDVEGALPISVQRFQFHLIAKRNSATFRGYRIKTQRKIFKTLFLIEIPLKKTKETHFIMIQSIYYIIYILIFVCTWPGWLHLLADYSLILIWLCRAVFGLLLTFSLLFCWLCSLPFIHMTHKWPQTYARLGSARPNLHQVNGFEVVPVWHCCWNLSSIFLALGERPPTLGSL